MRALAAARRNPVALTNLGAFFDKEVTGYGLSICISPSRISQAGEGRPKAICQSGSNISTLDRFIIGR